MADYEGRLTGAQIDALPGLITTAQQAADDAAQAAADEETRAKAAEASLQQQINDGVGTTEAVVLPSITGDETSTVNPPSVKGVIDYVAEKKAEIETEFGPDLEQLNEQINGVNSEAETIYTNPSRTSSTFRVVDTPVTEGTAYTINYNAQGSWLCVGLAKTNTIYASATEFQSAANNGDVIELVRYKTAGDKSYQFTAPSSSTYPYLTFSLGNNSQSFSIVKDAVSQPGMVDEIDDLQSSVQTLNNSMSSAEADIDEIQDLIETKTTPAETTYTNPTRTSSNFVDVANPLTEGVSYTISYNAQGSWLCVGLANATGLASSATDFDTQVSQGNIIQLAKMKTAGDNTYQFTAPSAENYPYLTFMLGNNSQTFSIVKDEIVEKGLESLLEDVGDVNDLDTESKTIVGAINEIRRGALKGKKVLFVGNSITQLPWTGSTRGNGIVEYFSELTGATAIRCAVGGNHLRARRILSSTSDIDVSDSSTEMQSYARAAFDTPYLIQALASGDWSLQTQAKAWYDANGGFDAAATEIVETLKTLDMSSVDAMAIFIGTNDYANSVVLGETTSTNIQEENGAWNYILETISTTFPHLNVFVFTPIVKMIGSTNNWTWCEETTNARELSLWNYCECNIAAAARFQFPSCDLYHGMGWNKYNFWNFFPSNDGTHPKGSFQHIAAKMASFIISHWNRY